MAKKIDIEKVTLAIQNAPEAWMRTNKSRTDGKCYEVGYSDNAKAEDGLHVVAAFAIYRAATIAQRNLQSRLQAEAAVKAMRR